MAKIENDHLIICIEHPEGTVLKSIQEALILSIETIACSETAGSENEKNAVYWLSILLRNTLLDSSQTNVALGGKAYKDVEKGAIRKAS